MAAHCERPQRYWLVMEAAMGPAVSFETISLGFRLTSLCVLLKQQLLRTSGLQIGAKTTPVSMLGPLLGPDGVALYATKVCMFSMQ